MNFNFGTPKTSAPTPTLNFVSGNTTSNAQTPAKAPAFGSTFPTPASTPGGGFNINPTPTATPTLNFNAPASSAPGTALSGFNLTAAPATTNLPTSTPGATTTSSLQLGVSTPATASTGFNLGATPASTGLAFGGLSAPVASSGSTPITSAAPGFPTGKLGAPVTSTSLLGATTSTALTLGTSTITPTVPSGSLNFNQIEELLNKWTLELEEQGKVFINQALQLNAWDRLVIANGEKILTLNNGIEKVKQQQQQLDHELEFVLIQQRELEECITPLEKELKDIPIADHDRNHTYQMAENMDTQLKQMSEDLKEIIEHLNESNKKEDNDAVSQIGRILNAHMNSLQWIDRNTAQISTLLDQITKMHDMHRRDNERSFHLTYE